MKYLASAQQVYWMRDSSTTGPAVLGKSLLKGAFNASNKCIAMVINKDADSGPVVQYEVIGCQSTIQYALCMRS